MTKRFGLSVATLALLSALAASCSSGVIGADFGTVTIAMRPPVGAKALDDEWPWGGPPVFSSMTFDVVDGTGESVLEADQPVVSGNTVTLRVRAGTGLRVSFDGEPNWAATATAYEVDAATLPAAALGYGGTSEAFDLEAGGSATATIALALSSTAIIVPSMLDDWRIAVATGLDDPDPDEYSFTNIAAIDDFFFDSNGTLYMAYNDYISYTNQVAAYGALDSPVLNAYLWDNAPNHVAYDPITNRIYGYDDPDGWYLFYLDLDDLEPVSTSVIIPATHDLQDGGIAIDKAGDVFLHMTNSAYEHVIVKFDVDTSTILDEVTFESLGLGYYQDSYFYVSSTTDIELIGDHLVFLFADVDNSLAKSRGLVAAIDPSNLSLLWASGWAGDNNDRPTDGTTQFYGPMKIIGHSSTAIYIFDEGFHYGGGDETTFWNIDRVIAIDPETGSFDGIGLDTVSQGYITHTYGAWM